MKIVELHSFWSYPLVRKSRERPVVQSDWSDLGPRDLARRTTVNGPPSKRFIGRISKYSVGPYDVPGD
jgi:hypothetical protein